jgi:hypothetical protein
LPPLPEDPEAACAWTVDTETTAPFGPVTVVVTEPLAFVTVLVVSPELPPAPPALPADPTDAAEEPIPAPKIPLMSRPIAALLPDLPPQG